jgi:ubiquinone/menaquinone biosynthesis C-methylase UbiE
MPVNLDKWTSGSEYDQWMGRWSRLLAEQFLQWLAISPGARWIDVCCGSGVVTKAIAERCLPKRVAGIDASAAQIAFANQHRVGDGISFEVGDAISIPFPDASFDVVVCGLGLNYISEPIRALEEMRRVASADGVIAAYVWDYAEGAGFLRRFWDAAASVDPEATSFDQAQRFPMCTPDGLRELFRAAHCQRIRVKALEIVTWFENFEQYWAPLLSGQGSAPNYLASRSQQIKTEIRERLKSSFQSGETKPIELSARAWAVRANCS